MPPNGCSNPATKPPGKPVPVCAVAKSANPRAAQPSTIDASAARGRCENTCTQYVRTSFLPWPRLISDFDAVEGFTTCGRSQYRFTVWCELNGLNPRTHPAVPEMET